MPFDVAQSVRADVRFARDAEESALLLDAAADLVGGISVVEVAKRGDTASDVGWTRRLEMSCVGA